MGSHKATAGDIRADVRPEQSKGAEKMKQYCRWCAYLCTGNGIRCDELSKEISEAAAKSPNRCHSFAYVGIDAFGSDKEYRPQQPKKKQCDGQLCLF